MADIKSPAARSKNMAAIKGKNTKPELLIRKALYARGFRYRLHDTKLPGKPDLVLKKYNAIILIHGCFWHKHDCYLFKWPATRVDFWKNKIESNVIRDAKQKEAYKELGWKILTIWECALKGKNKLDFNQVIDRIELWLLTATEDSEIKGEEPIK